MSICKHCGESVLLALQIMRGEVVDSKFCWEEACLAEAKKRSRAVRLEMIQAGELCNWMLGDDIITYCGMPVTGNGHCARHDVECAWGDGKRAVVECEHQGWLECVKFVCGDHGQCCPDHKKEVGDDSKASTDPSAG